MEELFTVYTPAEGDKAERTWHFVLLRACIVLMLFFVDSLGK